MKNPLLRPQAATAGFFMQSRIVFLKYSFSSFAKPEKNRIFAE